MRFLVAALLILVPRAALGAEGESMFSVTGSYATYTLEQGSGTNTETVDATGGTLLLEYERGVTDSLWIRGAAGGGVFDAGERSYAEVATVGITYQIDVLKYVPYVNLGLGTYYLHGGPLDAGFRPFLELGIGIDLLRSRSFSYGLAFRFDSFASEIAYFTAGARATWRWGFF